MIRRELKESLCQVCNKNLPHRSSGGFLFCKECDLKIIGIGKLRKFKKENE